MPEVTRQFSTYQHYKGGIYTKLCEALHAETDELLVVYTCAVSGAVFCRPKSTFEEQISSPHYTGPRFIPLPAATTKSQRQSLRYEHTQA